MASSVFSLVSGLPPPSWPLSGPLLALWRVADRLLALTDQHLTSRPLEGGEQEVLVNFPGQVLAASLQPSLLSILLQTGDQCSLSTVSLPSLQHTSLCTLPLLPQPWLLATSLHQLQPLLRTRCDHLEAGGGSSPVWVVGCEECCLVTDGVTVVRLEVGEVEASRGQFMLRHLLPPPVQSLAVDSFSGLAALLVGGGGEQATTHHLLRGEVREAVVVEGGLVAEVSFSSEILSLLRFLSFLEITQKITQKF